MPVELLRMPVEAGYSAPSDDDLRYTADEIFLEYDEREAQGRRLSGFWSVRRTTGFGHPSR